LVVGVPGGVDEVLMAAHAGGLGDAAIAGFDPDRFGKNSGREGERMEQPVIGFGQPFADRMRGEVAIVANGDMPMAGTLPGVEMAVHDVAVDAGCRRVRQVAGPTPVAEGEQAEPQGNTDRSDGPDGEPVPPESLQLERASGTGGWAGRFARRHRGASEGEKGVEKRLILVKSLDAEGRSGFWPQKHRVKENAGWGWGDGEARIEGGVRREFLNHG